MFSKHIVNCDKISYIFDGLLLMERYLKGTMLFLERYTHIYKYLPSTYLSSASPLFSTVSVWGWLAHGTLLKIDIRSICKRRLTKEWDGMKEHEGVWQRQRKTKGSRKRGRLNLLLHQTSTQRKQTHTSVQLWNGAGDRKWKFGIKRMRRFSRKVNGDRCRQQRCGTDDRHRAADCHTMQLVK